MKALVLAAGFATRMYPLTMTQAKPLLDIAGRPMLSRLVDRLLEIPALDEIIVIGNEKFADQFLAWRRGYDARIPIIVLNDRSTDDANKLGAIGDIGFALDQTPGEFDWLVVAGDNLFEFNPRPYYDEFLAHRDPLLLVRDIPDSAEKSRYNEVMLDAENIVTSFREKPKDHHGELAAICFYFFPPRVRGLVGEYLKGGGNPDAPGYFIQWLVGRERVRAARFHHPWFDIGNLATLEAARASYAAGA